MSEVPTDNEIDELALALGAFAREQDENRDGPWRGVTEGTDDVDEVVAQLRDQGVSEDELARDRALFSPLSTQERAAIMAAIEAPPAADPAPRSIVPIVVTTVLAIAAAVLVWVWIGGSETEPGSEPSGQIASVAPLPGYGLKAKRGLVDDRAEPSSMASPGERLYFRADTPLSWTLVPAEDIRDAIGVKVFASREAEQRALDLARWTETSPTGSVRIEGPARILGLAPGDWDISLVVGRLDSLPADLAQAQQAGSWHVLVQPIRIEARAEPTP